ncbi:MAG: hypothetical protein KGL39_20285 [Patescibacteria group bacterium]|nr:hypothetical protein [Patescibacteria group bacterium]
MQPEPVQMPVTENRQRPSRKPFGSLELKLAYPPRAGFHRHWFNDVPGRIERALEAGYEHVKDASGKNVNKVVGTAEGGGALHGFLMEIPEEWFKADMAAQQKIVDDREQAMRRGELESQEGDGRYVPKQGISIKHGS